MMKRLIAGLVGFLVVAAQIPFGLTLPLTAPAFLWSSNHQHVSSINGLEETVNYRTLSQRELAKSVISEGGWSKLLCAGEKAQRPVDVALVFVGRELESSDISRSQHADTTLMDLLKVSFTGSNFSRAFPYVAASEEEPMESSLISGFTETCEHGLGTNNIAFLESCSIEGEKFSKLSDVHSVHDYLISRMGNRQQGQTDLIVLCNGRSDSSEELEQTWSEGRIFSNIISSVEKLGASYSVLYTSDPHRLVQYPSYKALDRFLAEGTLGNGSAKAVFCDEICQMKSSFLEGILVGLVLLIILIFGLCCMMGIDTPTRFEAPQDN